MAALVVSAIIICIFCIYVTLAQDSDLIYDIDTVYYRGQSGIRGPAGQKGDCNCYEGTISNDVVDGENGQKEQKGDPGLPGLPGEDGLEGLPGFPGDKGTIGFCENCGHGEKGYRGDIGLKGIKGNCYCDIGLSLYWEEKLGVKGDIGDPGITGPPGPDGDRAHAGRRGDKGQQGRPGAPGFYNAAQAMEMNSAIGQIREEGGVAWRVFEFHRHGDLWREEADEKNNTLWTLIGQDKTTRRLYKVTEYDKSKMYNSSRVVPIDITSRISVVDLEGHKGNKGQKGDMGSCKQRQCVAEFQKRHKGTEPQSITTKKGEQGAPGLPGFDGLPGRDGVPGIKGIAGEDFICTGVSLEIGDLGLRGPKGDKSSCLQDSEQCLNVFRETHVGRRGRPGDRGITGTPGLGVGRGMKGRRGRRGNVGWKGKSGRKHWGRAKVKIFRSKYDMQQALRRHKRDDLVVLLDEDYKATLWVKTMDWEPVFL